MRRRIIFLMLAWCSVQWLSAHVETIAFADTTAKRICVERWDSDGDGELSYEEASTVTDLGNTFCLRLLKSPATLDELQYFTSLKEVGTRAFSDCYHLRQLMLPSSVMAIRDRAFWSCVALEHIQIPTSTQRLGHSCFFRCTSLQEITVPPSVRDSIPYQAFAYCSELQTATIEANVRIIGEAAFINCSRLMTATLPYTTTRLCSRAFSGCHELRQVFCRAVTPPALEDDVFTDRAMQNAVLFVPEEAVEAYREAPGWKAFRHIAALFD